LRKMSLTATQRGARRPDRHAAHTLSGTVCVPEARRLTVDRDGGVGVDDASRAPRWVAVKRRSVLSSACYAQPDEVVTDCDRLTLPASAEFGKGFDPSNQAMMRAFYLADAVCDALRHKLPALGSSRAPRLTATQRGARAPGRTPATPPMPWGATPHHTVRDAGADRDYVAEPDADAGRHANALPVGSRLNERRRTSSRCRAATGTPGHRAGSTAAAGRER